MHMRTAFDNSTAAVDETKIMSRIRWRLSPFLSVLYVFSFLDRVNLGNAHGTMVSDLKLTETEYAWGAGIFFIGYVLFEIPSNMILERVNARRWISRIMITWGTISACLLFVSDITGLLIARFLLGVAEAGFFPGVILYLTYWFTPHERTRIFSLFYSALPVAGAIGGLLAYGILQMEGLAGLHGWQWLFLLEGIPTVLLGFITWFYLPDSPLTCKWLSPTEQQFVIERLNNTSSTSATANQSLTNVPNDSAIASDITVEETETETLESNLLRVNPQSEEQLPISASETTFQPVDSSDSIHHTTETAIDVNGGDNNVVAAASVSTSLQAKIHELKATLCNGAIQLLALADFLTVAPMYSMSFFLPAIIAQFGFSGDSDPIISNLLSAIPYLVSIVVMNVISYLADRRKVYIMDVIMCTVGAAVSFIGLAVAMRDSASGESSLLLVLIQFILAISATSFSISIGPLMLTLMTSKLDGSVAIAVAYVVSCANIAGVVGPNIMSTTQQLTGGHALGLLMMAAAMLLAAGVIGVFALVVKRRDSKRCQQLTTANLEMSARD